MNSFTILLLLAVALGTVSAQWGYGGMPYGGYGGGYPPMYGGYGGYGGYSPYGYGGYGYPGGGYGYGYRHNPVGGMLRGALMGAAMGAMMGKK